jgi:hypothetical protein
MGQVRRVGNIKQGAIAPASSITDYEDFVILAQRTDALMVSVAVDASPAGRMAKAQKISLPEKEAAELRGSFLASVVRRTVLYLSALRGCGECASAQRGNASLSLSTVTWSALH